MTREILIPLDGSNSAGLALDVAADIAAKHDGRLMILHVGTHDVGPLKDLHARAEGDFDAAVREGRWRSEHPRWLREQQVMEYMGTTILAEGKARAEARGAQARTHLDWGAPAERILHHARQLPADMIVMSSRGASALGGLFMGSVSHKVSHLAPCTCVSVHPEKAKTHLADLKRIVVPTDGSAHATEAVRLAGEFAAKSGATLQLLHVLLRDQSIPVVRKMILDTNLDDASRRGLDEAERRLGPVFTIDYVPFFVPEDVLKRVGESILNKAEKIAAGAGAERVETKVVDGNPARAVLDAVEEGDADLVVMGTRGLGEIQSLLMGSVSYKINHSAPCSVITVR